MPVLRIQLLGDFRLACGNEAPIVVHPRQQALLAYLLLHQAAPQARQHLAFLFWPDTGEAQALTNLRNLLHKLRQTLPDAERYLQTDNLSVQWRPDAPASCDVAEFEACLARGEGRADLERAASLYHGELLPSCYDDWIEPERARLQQMALAALERLAALLEDRREPRAAIGYAERLRQLDPLNEATSRTLMRLYAAADDHASALRVYHTCARLLQEELGAEPTAETSELYRRIMNPVALRGSDRVPASGAGAAWTPLVGRQAQWQVLLAAWRAASGGRPACVFITGEAGIGKTRLAEELLAWTGRQGFAVAEAHCYAAEGSLAYAPVAAWLRALPYRLALARLEPLWLAEVGRLLPELAAERRDLPQPGPLTEGWQRKRLFEALARALLGQSEPLLLFLDDLQWCDHDTLEWLRFLLHFDPQARLLVVATARTEDLTDGSPPSVLLQALRRSDQLSELALEPLSAAETVSLAGQIVEQALTAEQSGRLYHETEGNPLFVVETARYGLEDSALQVETPRQPAEKRAALPPRIHAILHARLAQLSPEARELAGLAATIGREFAYTVLARASDQDAAALVRGLDELWQRRIVRERGAAAYDFTHDKLREVAYTSQSAARRHLLHRRVAQALEAVHETALDAVSGQIATHYELAGSFERAVLYYRRVGDMARRLYANSDAIRYYRRALALLGGPAPAVPALTAELTERLGDILHWTAAYDEARPAFQDALAALPASEPLARARLKRKDGNTLREERWYAEALETYSEAIRILEQAGIEQTPGWWHEWIQVGLEVLLTHYWLGQVAESAELRARLHAAVERHGTPGLRAAFYEHASRMEFRRNRSVATEEVIAMARAGLAAHQEAGNEAALPAAHFGLGLMLLWGGQPQASLEPLQTAQHLAEQTADISLQARCLTYLAIAHRLCGHVDETRQLATRAQAVAREAGMPEYVGSALANQAWLAWYEGAFDRARALGSAALVQWEQLPATHASATTKWTALWPLMAVALREGQVPAALGYAHAMLDPAQQRLPDALTQMLSDAIRFGNQGAVDAAYSLFEDAVALAKDMRFI